MKFNKKLYSCLTIDGWKDISLVESIQGRNCRAKEYVFASDRETPTHNENLMSR